MKKPHFSKFLNFALTSLMAGITLISAIFLAQQPIHASQNVNEHTLKAPYVVYGSGVSSEIYPKLNDIFQVNNNFKKITVDANDYRQYINPNATGTTNAAMISSVAIAPSDPGSGVRVNIKDYNGQNNILKVTSQQYAMVAQMAGVTDINIIVTANTPVSGESALTGVYKALAADGATIDTENTKAANEMIRATQPAIAANKDDKTYPGKLMAAIGEVSKQVAEQKQKTDQLATKQDIQKMLEQALQKQGIANQTAPQHITVIVNALITFENSPIASSKSYIKNVSNTINNVINSTGNLMTQAKDWLNSTDFKDATQAASKTAQSWITKIIQWFKELLNLN